MIVATVRFTRSLLVLLFMAAAASVGQTADLTVSTTSVKATVKPLKNIFYREAPRDLVWKINTFGRTLSRITSAGRELPFISTPFAFYEDAVEITVRGADVLRLPAGTQTLTFSFSDGTACDAAVTTMQKRTPSPLTIIAPNIEHGAAVVLLLPGGKTMLIDCAKDWARDSLLIPFLFTNNIRTIDYFFLTHYHGDHDSDDKGKKIIELFRVKKFYDYHSLTTGQTIAIGKTSIRVLNSFADGDEENTRSLSLKVSYNGFVYVHGGDTYAVNQERIMKDLPGDVKADVFAANHHFHGSTSAAYMRAMDPAIVLIQSEQAIYARSAYTEVFKKDTEAYLHQHGGRMVEDLPAIEIGTTVIRVKGKNDWTYETYRRDNQKIPFLRTE